MLTLRSFFVAWCLIGIISQSLSSNFINFGGTEDDSRQAAYYLSADSGLDTGPLDELKRTQRSLLLNLLKHGLFGECKSCCNNCNYDVGDGDNYKPLPPLQPPPVFGHPFHPLPLLQPFKPLFGPITFDSGCADNACKGGIKNNNANAANYPASLYGSGDNYNSNSNSPAGYDNSVAPATESYSKPGEPVYEMPSETPNTPVEPEYKTDVAPAADNTPEAPSNHPESEQSNYGNDEQSNSLQYQNPKTPQIVYQPIIYVSPQYLNKLNQEEGAYGHSGKSETNSVPEQATYSSDADITKTPDDSVPAYNTPVNHNQIPVFIMPYRKMYAPLYPQSGSPSSCLGHINTNPSVSTVSTIYTIIAPPLLKSPPTASSPYFAGPASNMPCSNSGPLKFSFYPSSMIPLDSYSSPSSAPTPTLPASTFLPPQSAPAPYEPTYTNPYQLTADDQPYRTCPELFSEYQRKLNMISPQNLDSYGGTNVYINAQTVQH